MIVQIFEARDLKLTGSMLVRIDFGDQTQSTQIKYSTNSPVWNEKFNFDVINQNEKIEINLMESSNEASIGGFNYELSNLKEPDYTTNTWSPIKRKNGTVVGQLRFSIQWIVSRSKFIENLIEKLNGQIKDMEAQLDFFSTKLNELESISLLLLDPFELNSVRAKEPEVLEQRPKTKTISTITNIDDLRARERIVVVEVKIKQQIYDWYPKVISKIGRASCRERVASPV